MIELPKLKYEYNALEPYMDEETIRIHHSKHHQTYTNNINKIIENTNLKDKKPEDIIKNLNEVSEDIRTAVRNNGGGYTNHKFFWTILKKDTEFKGEIAEAIKEKFESYEKFKEELSNAALTQFGSGWAWLVINNNKLEIVKTSNQDSPLTDGKTPILCIDVWEHAYYLKYNNRRAEYVENFFNIINWNKVNELYLKNKN